MNRWPVGLQPNALPLSYGPLVVDFETPLDEIIKEYQCSRSDITKLSLPHLHTSHSLCITTFQQSSLYPIPLIIQSVSDHSWIGRGRVFRHSGHVHHLFIIQKKQTFYILLNEKCDEITLFREEISNEHEKWDFICIFSFCCLYQKNWGVILYQTSY